MKKKLNDKLRQDSFNFIIVCEMASKKLARDGQNLLLYTRKLSLGTLMC